MEGCDVLVWGGSIKGCFAALAAAREGAQVVLLEQRSYLGSELTAYLRPWLAAKGVENISENVKRVLMNEDKWELADTASRKKNEIPFRCGSIKKQLLKLLDDNGVCVQFMTGVAGVTVEDSGLSGVVAGTKNGMVFIPAKAVIDAGDDRRVSRLSGNERMHYRRRVLVSRSIEFAGMADTLEFTLQMPEDFCLYDDKIYLHKSCEDKTMMIEFGIQGEMETGSHPERMKFDLLSRKTAVRIIEYLKSSNPMFADAILIRISSECCIESMDIEQKCTEDAGIIDKAKYENLFSFDSQSGRIAYRSFTDIEEMEHTAVQLGKMALQYALSRHAGFESEPDKMLAGTEAISISLGRKLTGLSTGIAMYDVKLQLGQFNRITQNYDVVVAGGGTAGANAAISAAEAGAAVCLVDYCAGPGGTQTWGGITGYYHGFRGPYTEYLDDKTRRVMERMGFSLQQRFMAEAKQQAYTELMMEQDVELVFNTMTAGVRMENNRICGIYAINSDGLGLIEAKVVVDATGDADVAAFAGASFHFGSEREGAVQTFSNMNLRGGGGDLGVIDNTDLYDLNRGIHIAHIKGDEYDFSPYLAVRESRHINGRYKISMADILLKREFEDTVAYARTDYDPHGISFSGLARMGYLPLQSGDIDVKIPYKCLLPVEVEGLLVTGKAVSATKDASVLLRMASDVQNLGYAAGAAAAMAARAGVMPHQIDIEELQRRLLEKGILTDEIKYEAGDETAEVEAAIEKLAKGAFDYLLKVLTCMSDRVVEKLADAYLVAEGAGKTLVAMALAWFGNTCGVDHLVSELEHLYTIENGAAYNDRHPGRNDGRPLCGFVGSPDLYWSINELIYVLGLARDKRALGILCRIAADTEAGGPPRVVIPSYTRGQVRIDFLRAPHYERILAICSSLERLADLQAVKALEVLAGREYLKGYINNEDIYAGGNFACAHLEVIIARTLARCGGIRGAMTLACYLEDTHFILSRHAYEELKAITGMDYGMNRLAWTRWLTSCGELKPKPFEGTDEM